MDEARVLTFSLMLSTENIQTCKTHFKYWPSKKYSQILSEKTKILKIWPTERNIRKFQKLTTATCLLLVFVTIKKNSASKPLKLKFLNVLELLAGLVAEPDILTAS